MLYDDVLELAHVLVRYISLRSEILTGINIKTVDCMDVMMQFQKTCCLIPYPEDGHSRYPSKTFSTIYQTTQGHISEDQS